jgi:multicomponent Na+:H+ antiporter subunit F
MSGAEFLLHCTTAVLILLGMTLLLVTIRVVRGPTLADRVLALDLLTVVAIGFVIALALRTGFTVYLDIAVALCLVGLLSTLALARYILSRVPAPPAPPPGRRASR